MERRYTQQEVRALLDIVTGLLIEAFDDEVEQPSDSAPFEPDTSSPLRLTWTTSAGFECSTTIDPALGPLIRIPWPVLRDRLHKIGERLAEQYARPDPYADELEVKDEDE